MEKTPIPPRKKERNQRCRTLCDSRSPKNGKPVPNRRQRNGHTNIYRDSMSALKRIQESTPTAAQWITKTIVEREKALSQLGWNTIYHWVPGHSKIAGNENADHAAKEAAKGPNQNGVQCMSKAESFTSIAHLNRIPKEKRTKESKE
jgi:hypothetical protein